MAGGGLIALLDDIATIADDVATLTVMATKKTSGIVTDDLAVTAEQTMGIERNRELPVVWAVAKGSFFNKAVILVPGALLLDAVAPWSIKPLLFCGGLFLCFEGVEKIAHKAFHAEDDHGSEDSAEIIDPEEFERSRVRGAIRTDLILSGEIIAITLGEIVDKPFLTKVAVFSGVSVAMTIGVYGLVAGLVKIDDAGEALVRRGGVGEPIGRAILRAAPGLMHLISWIGTVAMLLVGGHILLECIPPVEHALHDWLHHMHGWTRTLSEIGVSLLAGAIGGSAVLGAIASGLPGKLKALVFDYAPAGKPSGATESKGHENDSRKKAKAERKARKKREKKARKRSR